MDLREIYEQVKTRIAKLDFNALWQGFSPLRFALYNEKECCFDGEMIEKPQEFIANTSVQYNGEFVAIWNVMEEITDFDSFTASMVHEMFHGFQHISGECRWPDEIAALFDYQYITDNISLKLKEAEIMKEILLRGDASRFDELLSLRKLRAERYAKEYDYEARVEQIEGSANYVELKTLGQLDEEKAAKAWERIMKKIQYPESYLPIRVVSYAIGAAFLRCAQDCASLDLSAFDAVPFAVKAIENALPSQQVFPDDERTADCIRAYTERTRAKVEDALKKNDIVLNGSYPLCYLNVWNAALCGEYATSDYFVSYFDDGEQKTLYGNFVIKMGKDRIIERVYRR